MSDDRGQDENEGRRPYEGSSDDELFVWGDLRPPRPGSGRLPRPAPPAPASDAARDEETRREGADPQALRRSARARERRARAGGGFPPYLATHNDICRDDLLFEIELDAVTTA